MSDDERPILVVTALLTGSVSLLVSSALLVRDVIPAARGLSMVALMISTPDSPPVICPLVEVSDEFTLNVSCCPKIVGVTEDPLSVALTKVVPVGRISVRLLRCLMNSH
jgi:hypothetical protein